MATLSNVNKQPSTSALLYESRRVLRNVFRYGILSIIGFTFMLPFILAALGGFKTTEQEIRAFPPRVFPDGWVRSSSVYQEQLRVETYTNVDDWQVLVASGQQVNENDLIANDSDGNPVVALYNGTVELFYALTLPYNAQEVLISAGDVVDEDDVVAIDAEGNEIRSTASGDIFAVYIGVPRDIDRQNRRVSLRESVTAGQLLAVEENGQELRAGFAGQVEFVRSLEIEQPFSLNRVVLSQAFTRPFYALTDLFSDETRVVPDIELYGAEELLALKQEPFDVTFQTRVGWTVRDQYGISNWINVFTSIEGCDGWLGPYCFPYWLWNSFFLAALNVMTRVFFAILAGYAFARMEFPGKNVVFTFMLATLMLPGAVTLIPGYVLIADLGWVGVPWSLVFPSLVEVFGIFLMTQFLKAIPRDLEEAARVDGASQWQIVWRVVIPLARPALVTLAILSFQGSWNAFQGPLLYLRGDNSVFTLPVGLNLFKAQFRTQWNFILIGSMFNAIPVLILFLIFNRYFIEGVSYSGVKG